MVEVPVNVWVQFVVVCHSCIEIGITVKLLMCIKYQITPMPASYLFDSESRSSVPWPPVHQAPVGHLPEVCGAFTVLAR